MPSSSPTVFLLAAVLLVALAGIIYLTISKKTGRNLNVKKYQTKWLAVENSISKDNESSWQVAILNADKLLDLALRESRLPGETMGARLKAADKLWTSSNNIWSAHKLRNRLAHEVDNRLTYKIACQAVAYYKRALKDLGAI